MCNPYFHEVLQIRRQHQPRSETTTTTRAPTNVQRQTTVAVFECLRSLSWTLKRRTLELTHSGSYRAAVPRGHQEAAQSATHFPMEIKPTQTVDFKPTSGTTTLERQLMTGSLQAQERGESCSRHFNSQRHGEGLQLSGKADFHRSRSIREMSTAASVEAALPSPCCASDQ